MRMEIPNAQKIHTTIYDNFRGVDYTNDPSNIWHRRTADGVNMLPDEAGRPFKRTGWEKVVTADNFADKFAEDTGASYSPSETTIRKCYYFDLAGVDHIVIFTNYGVFVYHSDTLYSSKDINPTSIAYSADYQNLTDAQKAEYDLAYESYNSDMIESFDRAFFFEGAGKAGFYIYGGFKIWEYAYTDNDTFTWQTVEPHVPRVNIGVDARHESGTSYENINMLSDYICEEFQDNSYLRVTSATTDVSGGSVTVSDVQFIAMLPSAGTYVFTYTDADHSWLLGGDQVMISNYGIQLTGTPTDGKKITVVLTPSYRINLPRVIVDPSGMKVEVSVTSQFNKKLDIITSGSPSSTTVLLKKDNADNFSHLEFDSAYLPIVDGEDSIRVTYPRNAITTTPHTVSAISRTATAD